MAAGAEVVGDDVGADEGVTVNGTGAVEEDVVGVVVKGVADASSRQLEVLVVREVQSAKMRQCCCSSR
jgi:hypothetical protein